MKSLEKKIPPPLVALICAIAMWLIAKYAMKFNMADVARIAGALAVFVIGLSFDIAGMISFRRAKTTVNPLKPESASSLVNSGIYRFSRNPMYVGLAFVLVAWAIYLASPISLVGCIGFVLYMNYFQIEPEERALMALFGKEYEQYKSRVRRWL